MVAIPFPGSGPDWHRCVHAGAWMRSSLAHLAAVPFWFSACLSVFYEAAVNSQAPHVCRCQSHDADGAMGRSRAAFYSRFLVSPRSPRIMSFASAGGAISVTIVADHTTERAHPPARGFAGRRDDHYAVANFAMSNVVSSRHSANRMRLNRRAKATTAMRRPRRAARRSPHARNVPLPG